MRDHARVRKAGAVCASWGVPGHRGCRGIPDAQRSSATVTWPNPVPPSRLQAGFQTACRRGRGGKSDQVQGTKSDRRFGRREPVPTIMRSDVMREVSLQRFLCASVLSAEKWPRRWVAGASVWSSRRVHDRSAMADRSLRRGGVPAVVVPVDGRVLSSASGILATLAQPVRPRAIAGRINRFVQRPLPQRHRGVFVRVALERFRFKRNRTNALSLCFYAFPDGKPLRTFPGNSLALASED